MVVVAPFVTTYASHTPYITVDEWRAAPTAIDISSLLPDGNRTQQDQVVRDCIERASSWIDDLCQQVLAASEDIQSGRFLVNRFHQVKVPAMAKPVLEVSAVSVGGSPSTLLPLDTLDDVEISPYGVVTIPVNKSGSGQRALVRMTFVNGYPNTVTTAANAAGDSTLVLDNAVGVYPGSPLTVYDVKAAGTENIVVASTYTGGTTIPLVDSLRFAHAAGVSVSSLPARVKQACILLTSALIQTRGSDAIVLDSMDTPAAKSNAYGANEDAERLARTLLGSLRRTS